VQALFEHVQFGLAHGTFRTCITKHLLFHFSSVFRLTGRLVRW
jgi:hypothetical protein